MVPGRKSLLIEAIREWSSGHFTCLSGEVLTYNQVEPTTCVVFIQQCYRWWWSIKDYPMCQSN